MGKGEPDWEVYKKVARAPPPGQISDRDFLGLRKNQKEQSATRKKAKEWAGGHFRQPNQSTSSLSTTEPFMSGALPNSDTGSRIASFGDDVDLPGILKESRPTSSAQPSRNEFKVDKSGTHPRSSDLAERVCEGVTTADITEVIKGKTSPSPSTNSILIRDTQESATAGTAINKSSTSVDVRFAGTNPNGTINVVAILTHCTDLISLPEVKATDKQHTTILGALQNLLLECMESKDVGRVQRA